MNQKEILIALLVLIFGLTCLKVGWKQADSKPDSKAEYILTKAYERELVSAYALMNTQREFALTCMRGAYLIGSGESSMSYEELTNRFNANWKARMP